MSGSPGDCLTDDEIRAGQRGVYNGPVNTNPDMSGVRVETPAQSTGVTGSTRAASHAAAASSASRGAPARLERDLLAASAGGGTGRATLFGGPATSAGPTLNGPGFSLPAAPRVVGEAPCRQGLAVAIRPQSGRLPDRSRKGQRPGGRLSRRRGCCERCTRCRPRRDPGQRRRPRCLRFERQRRDGIGGGNAAPACRKGWLWPFVRRAGDCPTDAERGRR